MLDGLYCEFLKQRRTGYYKAILLSCVFLLFICTLYRGANYSNWYAYFFSIEVITFACFYTIIIPLFVSVIFIQEFKNNTASTIFSYPNGRLGTFIDKFLMSIFVVAGIYILSYILIVISGLITLDVPLSAGPFVNHLRVFLVSFAFQVALIPLTILVASISKKIIFIFIYSMVLLMANINYLLGINFNDFIFKNFIFSILPASPVAKLGINVCLIPVQLNMVITKLDISLGIFIFLIGFIGCIIYYKKSDIH